MLLKNTNRTDISIASFENFSKKFAIIGWKLFGKPFEKVRSNWLKVVVKPFDSKVHYNWLKAVWENFRKGLL